MSDHCSNYARFNSSLKKAGFNPAFLVACENPTGFPADI
jgi:hypothetical protein